MNNLEDRLREGLHAPLGGDAAESMLARVHTGAQRRRHRRTAAIAAAAVAVLAGSLVSVGLLDRDNGPSQPVQPTPQQISALADVVDIAASDADHVFAVSAGKTSTVWHLSEGSWQRLHDFKKPIKYVEFADASNGWVWGEDDQVFSTHDGGRTWHVSTGLVLLFDGTSLSTTKDRVWGIERTDGFGDFLVSSPVGFDDWTSEPLPQQVNDVFTTRERAVLEQFLWGVDTPRLLHGTDGNTWSRLDFPCAGENQAYPGPTAVFVICAAPDGATVYRSVDLASWQVFGHSDLSAVTAVIPLADDQLLLVGEPNDLLVTPSGSRVIDLGLRTGEDIFQGTFDTVGDTTYAVTSEHRIIVTRDAGLTWSQLG
jgi:hypothetical protein